MAAIPVQNVHFHFHNNGPKKQQHKEKQTTTERYVAIGSATLLAISEALPFVKTVEANGLLDIVKVLMTPKELTTMSKK